MDNNNGSNENINTDQPENISEVIGIVIGIISIIFTAKSLLRFYEQQGNALFPNELLDTGSLSVSFLRGYINSEKYHSELNLLGYDSDRISLIQKLTENLLTVGDLINAIYRQNITDDEFYTQMAQIGIPKVRADILKQNFISLLSTNDVIEAEFRGLSGQNTTHDYSKDLISSGLTTDRIELLRTIALKIPAITELFQFKAWDIDNPQTVSDLQLNSGLSQSFLDEVYKLGIDEKLATRLWNSHWDVPPLFILKTLYQTGQISTPDLKIMLQTMQIAPIFIDPITKSFSKPLSEGQIKSMYKNGILTSDQIPSKLSQLGYLPEDIPLIAKELIAEVNNPTTTAKTEKQAQKLQFYGLTESSILSSYKDGLINNATASTYLSDIGYPSDIITMHLSLADFEIAKTAMKAEIDLIHTQYLQGEITQTDVISDLTSIGVPDIQQQTYIYKWDKEIAKTNKQPTKAELDVFLKDNIISQALYIQQLEILGYNSTWINAFLYSITKTAPPTPFDINN